MLEVQLKFKVPRNNLQTFKQTWIEYINLQLIWVEEKDKYGPNCLLTERDS